MNKYKVLGLMFVALTLAVSSGFAATPSSGTLTAPAAGQTTSVSFGGGPLTGATASPAACTTLNCDTFTLTVNVPSTFYSANPTYAVHVKITWASNTNDFDLNVNDASGNTVCNSGQGQTNFEDADCGQLASGTYTVQVVGFTVVNATYNGSATLAPEPAMSTGQARYRKSNVTFSAPQELQRPNNPANATGTIITADQDVEPRIVHDVLGNYYVAAIQGVPGGIDVWKSSDSGNSFNYLGQPDGVQIGAALGADGVGLGGGDEDIAVSPSGVVYASSLWLGSATQSTSFTGGTVWVSNPISSDLPLVDRQWIAPHGNSELYLTTKQLGADLDGTVTLFVAKSFDNGLTWPQVAPVTTPEIGVQPGDQGNITVDQNNGNVYTIFIDQHGNIVWLARSSDGGKTWIVKQVFAAPAGTNLANIFPVVAVDSASNVFVVFCNGTNVFLTASTNQGGTWTTPVRVNNGAGSKTAMGPWITASGPGRVNIAFWGTSAGDANSTTAQWQVFNAQSRNATTAIPTITQVAATPIMHVGPICNQGLACASGTRNLAEYFAPDIGLNGEALIVYPDDKNTSSPSGAARTFFVKQTGGSTLQ
ncbi:MAG TPA: sialidase family protein [Candidatus Angelobacter sp.]|nr:sialidase family protein [Candidatus Angelobacter sp.]